MWSASMIKSASDYINFCIEGTQVQQGGVDCGLFAIAYAIEFWFGNCSECYRQIKYFYYSKIIIIPSTKCCLNKPAYIINLQIRPKCYEATLHDLHRVWRDEALPCLLIQVVATEETCKDPEGATSLRLSLSWRWGRANGFLLQMQNMVLQELPINPWCCIWRIEQTDLVL